MRLRVASQVPILHYGDFCMLPHWRAQLLDGVKRKLARAEEQTAGAQPSSAGQ